MVLFPICQKKNNLEFFYSLTPLRCHKIITKNMPNIVVVYYFTIVYYNYLIFVNFYQIEAPRILYAKNIINATIKKDTYNNIENETHYPL